MCDQTLEYFLRLDRVQKRDAAEVSWSHAVNSRSKLTEALTGPTHMIEGDIVMRGCDPKEPIMAHPPDRDSDLTLREWLVHVKMHSKGVKLDFKSLAAASPSLVLLDEVLAEPSRPVWINANILTGPGAHTRPLNAQAFLSALTTLSTDTVLSLGYSWDMVCLMNAICGTLKHPVTFPVRAALLAHSFSQLSWLLQQSDRYTLTVWTGQNDELILQDLLPYRKEFEMSKVYFDLPNSVRTELSMISPDNT